MEYKFIVTDVAEKNIKENYVWYESKKPELGEEFLAELDEHFHYIKINPNLFPIKYRKKHEASMKRFPFVVIYEVVETEIVILSVFKTPQDPAKKP